MVEVELVEAAEVVGAERVVEVAAVTAAVGVVELVAAVVELDFAQTTQHS